MVAPVRSIVDVAVRAPPAVIAPLSAVAPLVVMLMFAARSAPVMVASVIIVVVITSVPALVTHSGPGRISLNIGGSREKPPEAARYREKPREAVRSREKPRDAAR